MSTRAVQAVLGLGGLAAGVYGLVLLLQLDLSRLVSTVVWLGGGVVVHDGVLAPLVVAVCVVAARLLPRAARVPAAVALVVWGTVTIAVLPVLSGQGGKPDNPTLLDRPYGLAWNIGTVLVLVVTAGASLLRARRQRGQDGRERVSRS